MISDPLLRFKGKLPSLHYCQLLTRGYLTVGIKYAVTQRQVNVTVTVFKTAILRYIRISSLTHIFHPPLSQK